MHLDGAREVEGHSDAVALDGNDAHNAHRARGVSDDDFFTFTSSND